MASGDIAEHSSETRKPFVLSSKVQTQTIINPRGIVQHENKKEKEKDIGSATIYCPGHICACDFLDKCWVWVMQYDMKVFDSMH